MSLVRSASVNPMVTTTYSNIAASHKGNLTTVMSMLICIPLTMVPQDYGRQASVLDREYWARNALVYWIAYWQHSFGILKVVVVQEKRQVDRRLYVWLLQDENCVLSIALKLTERINVVMDTCRRKERSTWTLIADKNDDCIKVTHTWDKV